MGLTESFLVLKCLLVLENKFLSRRLIFLAQKIMKLSFSIPSKSSSSSSSSTHKPKPPLLSSHHQIEEVEDEEEEEVKEYVTQFDPSKTLQRPNPTTQIIPPLQNELHPQKRMKNLVLPPLQSASAADGEILFEVESLSSADPPGNNMSYGLNLRQKATDTGDNDKGKDVEAELEPKNVETEDVSMPKVKYNKKEDVLLANLKYDLKRSQDVEFEDFEDMPVESFAKAWAHGYDWHEGQGLGKKPRQDVKVKEYKKITSFAPMSGSSNIDNNKPKEKKVKEKEKRRGQEEREDGFFVGKDVRVIGGRREDAVGSKGSIVERLDSNWVVLKLAKTHEKVKVRVVDIADLGSKEEEKCLKQLKESNIRQVSNADNERRNAEPSTHHKESAKRGNGEVRTNPLPQRERGVQWLTNHIRVRIISKDLKGGRLYLKKGEVVDVVGPYMCDISMDESRELIQYVDQDLLETALPHRGGPVLILYGKNKGVYGKLVQRDLDQEIGVVQESGSHELLNVKLEQVAEYVGDPGYIGY